METRLRHTIQLFSERVDCSNPKLFGGDFYDELDKMLIFAKGDRKFNENVPIEMYIKYGFSSWPDQDECMPMGIRPAICKILGFRTRNIYRTIEEKQLVVPGMEFIEICVREIDPAELILTSYVQ